MLREGEDLPKIPELESSGAGIPIPGLQLAVLQTKVSSIPWKTTLLCRLENKENKKKLDTELILGFKQQLGAW